MGRINDVLIANGGEMGFNDINSRVRGKEQHVREALAVLMDEGYVRRRNGPRGAHLHELVAPFNG